MPPTVASLVYVGFIIWLFRRDLREQRGVTGAFWLPVIWLTMCSTRCFSQWLEIFGIHLGGGSVEEGSPLDALVFFLLIAAGFHVLNQRQVSLSVVIRHNGMLALFFAYCFVSVLWSDFPFVALKRLLKDLGHPVMVLVLLTEPDPLEAVVRVMKRCAYVFAPVSILFIKYYPQWGRGYSEWTGAAAYCGVAFDKNMLGLGCFILGVFFFWHFLNVWQTEKGKPRRKELYLVMALLGMIGWLFHMAQSSTSLVSSLIAAVTLLFLRLRWVNPRYISIYLLAAIAFGVVAEGVFGIYTSFLQVLGKDPTLTDRTLIWHDLLEMRTNPLLGVGFESFWLGDRLKPLWAKWLWHPNESHNGYLETYLDLGVIGLALFFGLFVSAYRRASRDMLLNPGWGRYRMALLVAVICYNWTEVPFRATNPLWFCFFLILMDYPAVQFAPAEPTSRAENSVRASKAGAGINTHDPERPPVTFAPADDIV